MSDDTDNLVHSDFTSTSGARNEMAAEFDRRLEESVRAAAEKVFSKSDRDPPPWPERSNELVAGASMEDRMRSVFEAINSPERHETDFWTSPPIPKAWAGTHLASAVHATAQWLVLSNSVR